MPKQPRSWLTVLAVMTGCASWLPAPEPMRALDAEKPGARAKCLMVFLPGGGDSAESFARSGFVEDVRATRYSIDMVSANATMGYYMRGIFTERLWNDVVRRRALRGYTEVWLVGPSMGGFGSLLYARQRPPGEVAGVFALAPFLGRDGALFDEIERAGGLERWRAPPERELTEEHYAPELWRWLQVVAARKTAGPALYLGYGRDDHLARVDGLVAQALPDDRVFIGDGGHNWRTWRTLFRQFLARGPLKQRCGY